jgi:hypothetical protein
MAYGVILKHLEVDKKLFLKRGVDSLFGGKEGGALICAGSASYIQELGLPWLLLLSIKTRHYFGRRSN